MKPPYYTDDWITLHHGDALDVCRDLDTASADCVVTSPPFYGLRDYGVDGQYGLESSPAEYVERLAKLFAEIRRVLADDGTLWLNIGDSYSISPPGKSVHAHRTSTLDAPGRPATVAMRESVRAANIDRSKFLPTKNMLGIPWRVAFALQDDGWILRNAIVWHKPNAMPEGVTDRLSGRYEHVFLFSKQQKYWFDLDAIRGPHSEVSIARSKRRRSFTDNQRGYPGAAQTFEPIQSVHINGRNPGDVWEISTQSCPDAHFAVFPPQLPQRCIAAGCKPGGTVLDPFSGIGTTGLAAQLLGRRYVGIDLNAEYLDLSLKTRLNQATFGFEETGAP